MTTWPITKENRFKKRNRVSDIVNDLKLGKLISHKYIDNVETDSDKKKIWCI